MLYEVRKYVEAKSIEEAILLEKKVKIDKVEATEFEDEVKSFGFHESRR